ncbi:aspartate racemase [Scopulibacillus daqui]|uniref:Aspartate racemase n=1 Tax=Scopulibacillus daqui TaxID=1469162 RepID=A0ABS2PVY1_9BACL|nr:amino acid racemase [Scopulibacillus daqui]MBM7644123.1 aspartate racemase [Scopulibacillus daqui]
MKTIGIIGGITWESTVAYYERINQLVNQKLGKNHSAKCLINSLNYEDVNHYLETGKWDQVERVTSQAAKILEQGGADLIIIASNTMHKVADLVQHHIAVPVLHIIDPLVEACEKKGAGTIGLVGTIYTMEDTFYIEKLNERGLQVVIPDEEDRDLIHDIILSERKHGKVSERERRDTLQIMQRLVDNGADSIVIGCTKGDFIHQDDVNVPLYHTTNLHVEKIVSTALEK